MPTSEVTDATFEEKVLNSDKPVLVDFWAAWCGPCRMLSPIIEQLSDEYKDTIEVFTMDVDENPETAKKYHINSIPAVLAFKDGKKAHASVGAKPKGILEAEFSTYLEG